MFSFKIELTLDSYLEKVYFQTFLATREHAIGACPIILGFTLCSFSYSWL